MRPTGSAVLGHLIEIGPRRLFSFPPTVSALTGDGRCPRCGRRHGFTGPFWCSTRLADYYLCNCGVRYEPRDGEPAVGITDF